jgi:hypothetical protein
VEVLMKNSTVTISYDEEKLAALRLFLTQKDLDLDKELIGFLAGLFKRHVPQNVRDYLELKDCVTPDKAAKRPPAPVSLVPQDGS